MDRLVKTSGQPLCIVIDAGSNSKTAWRTGWATDSFWEAQSPLKIFQCVYETVRSALDVNFLNAWDTFSWDRNKERML